MTGLCRSHMAMRSGKLLGVDEPLIVVLGFLGLKMQGNDM